MNIKRMKIKINRKLLTMFLNPDSFNAKII